MDEKALGELIGGYVRTFDKYLKAYFAGIADPQTTARQLEAAFRTEADAVTRSI